MRLLVHIAGEADLLLGSGAGSEETRAALVSARCAELMAALAGPAGATAALDLLSAGIPQNGVAQTQRPSPLLGTLAVLDNTPDLTVVVLGTDQRQPHCLDTLPIAEAIAAIINKRAAEDDAYPFRTAAALAVPDLQEESVVTALTAHLGESTSYEQALMTWGSGSTTMAMGALTALSQAGVPWQLVLTNNPAGASVVDPLDQLDVDPVVGVFVRWRMYDSLADLARQEPPTVQLTDAQHDLIDRAAQRRRAGLEARDCASLRAVLADAVVRRDGTASLAVRRYVTSRYEELLALDKADHPWAEDLLRKYEKPNGGPPLGAKLRKITHNHHDDPMVCASIDLQSYRWLFGPVVTSLQNIGKGSHNLRPPAGCDSKILGEYLSRYKTDETGWADVGLPEPPVTPADTVLAVWPAGIQRRSGSIEGERRSIVAGETVGQQLSQHDLPEAVSRHVGLDKMQIRALILGVDDGHGSRDLAEADAHRIRTSTHEATGEPRGEAWIEWTDLAGAESTTIERAIDARLTRETAALLLIPTGSKSVVLALLGAMRRLGARRGVPLFVRQNAKSGSPGAYEVHQWPALTGGDLPLLIAARRALQSLELDVAWRLLAASAIDRTVIEKARQLADAFACRGPLGGNEGPAASGHAGDWKMGMIAQRLELVEAALSYAEADQIRLLVLAADAMEASVGATQTSGPAGLKYRQFREALQEVAARRDRPEALPERVLLLLNHARDRAPITHGNETDPDAVVAEAAHQLAVKWELSQAESDALPRDLSSLLRCAFTAAETCGYGWRGTSDSLLLRHREIISLIDVAIGQRRSRSN
ncbi:hypothetical protein ACFYO8_00315 [Micromonospora sp. NPDC005257]|uniref:hypothetical protein n=1 Tax=Micromonospora sp. NPDC005257 TaxID=3364230 RepID=UPI0036CA4894